MELKLSTLSPGRGARKKGKRVGRGEASGLGKTSGRGGKGQTARTGGKVAAHFEGGQMPLYRRLPKLGFKSRQKMLGSNRYCLVTLGDIEAMPGVEVTPKSLLEAGIRASSGQKAGYKILANGTLSKKVSVRVHAISAGARAKIESIGGKVELITE